MRNVVLLQSALLCSTIGNAAAYDECRPSHISYDVCDAAAKLAENQDRQVPFKLTEELSLTKISSSGPYLDMQIAVTVPVDILRRDVEFNAVLRAHSVAVVCKTDRFRSFVNLGGIFRFRYTDSNGLFIRYAHVDICE